jgi:sulfofructose kinase
MGHVLAVGLATVDNIVLVDRYPERDERVLAIENARSVGGPATVAAIAMARLGVEVSLSTVIGSDEAGDFVLDVLKQEGVETKLIERSHGNTSQSTIVVSRSESSRAIMVKPERVAPKRPNQEFPAWVHVDHFGAEVIKSWGVVRGMGPKLSLDIGYPVDGVEAKDFDLYVPSEKITTDLDTASRDANTVVISHGERGSSYSDGSSEGLVPAFEIDALSTLGAGDVFHGALVATRIWGMPIRDAVIFSNAVAALSCRGLDGYSKIPNRQETLDFIKTMEK